MRIPANPQPAINRPQIFSIMSFAADSPLRIARYILFPIAEAKIFCHGILLGGYGKDLATNFTHFCVCVREIRGQELS